MPDRTRRSDGHEGHRPKKTALLVAQRIVSEIVDNGLEAGFGLPPEKDMLVKYGVARGSLREALRFLEMEGVLTIKPGPGGGPTVSEPDHRALASTIALLLQFAGAEFRTIVEARRVLEPAMAEMAAERAGDEDLAAMRASLDAMAADLKDEQLFLRENERFHELIAAASGNQLFAYLIQSLSWITDGGALGVQYSARHRAAVHEAHLEIFDAIAAGDPGRARAAMERHIDEFADHLERRYPKVMNQPLRWEEFQ
jgi:DNA-binding FadR family transcriptional regulator